MADFESKIADFVLKMVSFDSKMTEFRIKKPHFEDRPKSFSSQKCPFFGSLFWGLLTPRVAACVGNNEWARFILGLGQSFVYDHVTKSNKNSCSRKIN